MNLFSQHTSVSLSINENGIPDVHIGMKIILNKFALEDNSYEQLDEREDDLPAHAKCSLLGSSMNIPIISRRLVFGTWSGAHLWEQRNCAGSQNIVMAKVEHKPHTLLYYCITFQSDFKFYVDRLINLTVKIALAQFLYVLYDAIIPSRFCFRGLRQEKKTFVNVAGKKIII
ncbi:unnamed protein product [Rotaria sp. Silwood2]|nr:unnamed protein product [Rotaria sp. Silwood2]